MKRIVTLLAATVMMTIATNSFAQMSAGAGYLNGSDKVSVGDVSTDMNSNGFYLGFSYNIPVADAVGIAPGIYYSFLYSKDNLFGMVDTKTKEHFINVPVYLNFGFNLTDNAKLILFAGPTAQFGLDSHTEYSTKIIEGLDASGKQDNYKDSDYSRTNILIGGGVGVNIGKVIISAGYDYGLFNLNTSDSDVTRRKSYIKCGLAYMF